MFRKPFIPFSDIRGHFLATRVTETVDNSADLVSPVIPADADHCQLLFAVSFPMGLSLTVLIRQNSSDRVVWSQGGFARGLSMYAYHGVTINSSMPFRIIFRAAALVENATGEVRLDDIKLRQCLPCELTRFSRRIFSIASLIDIFREFCINICEF